MNMFALAFLFGTCSILLFTLLPSIKLLITVFFTAIFLCFLKKNNFTLFIVGTICGFCWVMLFAHIRLQHRIPKKLEGKTIVIQGMIKSLPKQNGYIISFLFQTEKVQGVKLKRTYKLSYYSQNTHIKNIKSFSVGDRWRFAVRLKRAHGFMNPGGFDYEAYLFAQNVDAVGYIINNSTNKLLIVNKYRQLFNRLRQAIQKKIVIMFPGNTLRGFLSALIIGYRQDISQEQWQILRKTGTNHLIAIAGLHISLIAGFVYLLTGYIWRRFSFLNIRISSQQVGVLCGSMAALFYSFLAGFSLQTQRALIMLSIISCALYFRRRIVPFFGLSAALFIILSINPLKIITISFWMSFASVAAIVYATHGRINSNYIWKKWCRIQFVIMLGIMPLSLLFFHEASIISIIANTIAVPFFGVIIMPLCFFGVISIFINIKISFLFLWVALRNLQILWLILHFLANIPVGSWQQSISTFWLFGFIVIAVLLLLAPKGFYGKGMALCFILPLLSPDPVKIKNGEVWFTLLDVGQGLSSILRTKNHVLIYDTGPRFSKDFDAGEAVMLPYLSNKNIKIIDKLFVSHGDNDHIGGARSIIQNIAVKEIFSSIPEKISKTTKHCFKGQHWNWDGVQFKILWPIKGASYEGNNSSCVLHIKAGRQSILLVGDIEKPIEKKLLRLFKHDISSMIIVAPHHGSITSSSETFVQAIKPKYVLFPVGYRNRFHFPNKIVVKRYRDINAISYDTVHDGAISFKLDGFSPNIEPGLYRSQHYHIWNE